MVTAPPMREIFSFIGGSIWGIFSPNGNFTLKGNGIGGTPPIEPVNGGSNGVWRCPTD